MQLRTSNVHPRQHKVQYRMQCETISPYFITCNPVRHNTIQRCWWVLSPTYFPMYFVWWWEYFFWC